MDRREYVYAKLPTTETLNGLNLSIQAGELLAFIKPSGIGNATLLAVVAGLVEPTEDTIRSLDFQGKT